MSAFARGLEILTALQTPEAPLSFGLLRDRVEIPAASFARLLGELVETGCIQKTDRGYRLGLRCLALAMAARNQRPLHIAAGDHLSQIVEETGESAELVEFFDGQFVFLDRCQSEQAVVLRARVGSRFEIHPSNAIGAVAMAAGLGGNGPLTESPAELFPDRAQAQCFQNRGEVYRAASALFDSRQRCIGCISIAAPAYRATPQRCKGFLEVLARHAAEIQKTLSENLVPERQMQT
jgi:DNA-binding IclR family transcriptional regulator